MLKFFAVVLFAGLAVAKPDIQTFPHDSLNTFETVNERDFGDTYGAPAADPISSYGSTFTSYPSSNSYDGWTASAPTAYAPAAAPTTGPFGLGFGANADLGFTSNPWQTLFTFVLISIGFYAAGGLVTSLYNSKVAIFDSFFSGRSLEPETVSFILTSIEDFAHKYVLQPEQ